MQVGMSDFHFFEFAMLIAREREAEKGHHAHSQRDREADKGLLTYHVTYAPKDCEFNKVLLTYLQRDRDAGAMH